MEKDIGRELIALEDRFKMRACSPVAIDFPCAPKIPELPHGVAHPVACGILAALEQACCGAGMIVCGTDLVTPSSLDRLGVPESGNGLQQRTVERNGNGQPFRQEAAEPVRGLLRFVVAILIEPHDDQTDAPPKDAEDAGVEFVLFDRTGPVLFEKREDV
jgi:hypothetical protein